jgi:D-psicose/D-tagatose/L-ribulose 3-epimerase
VRFAVSNIAWPRELDSAVAEVLNELGIGGVEIAPTKIHSQPLAATAAEIEAVRAFWAARGIAIVAAQSLLFGKPELTLFESESIRQATFDYLAGVIRFCGMLGAKSLVFGSPKNRRIGSLRIHEANRIAVDFFTRVAEVAATAGTCVVLEANPPLYGADFITTAADAIALVERVNHPGFRLHLDSGCMTLAGDPIHETFANGRSLLQHFHVSEPNLDPPGDTGQVDHAAFAAELHAIGYSGWVSLEMRETQPFSLASFAETLRWLKARYQRKL